MSTINGFDATDKYVYAFEMNNTSPSAPLGSLMIADDFRARDAPAVAYDSSRGEMVFINGYSAMDDDTTIADGEHVAEIWAYNRTSNKWRMAMGGPTGMPQNEGGLAVYDSVNDRIIHFGGLAGSSQMTNDVWELKADSYGVYRARKLTPSGTLPPQRWLAAGCYDAANQRLIVWGGQNQSTILNDVWALSLSGAETWTQLSPTGTAPTAVWQSAYAFDAATKRLYVHGGFNGVGYSTQLFYLDVTTTNGAWVNTNVTGGLAVRGAVMGYDSVNQRLVCFGGFDGSAVNNTVRYTSTSSFTSWTTQSTTNTPAARRSAGAAVIGNAFVMACGRPISGTWFSDTQELNFQEAPAAWQWQNKSPSIYQRLAVAATGLSSGASYHWQTWATVIGASSVFSPFGGNAETAADFIISDASAGKIKVYTGSAWALKPVKFYNGSTWLEKPLKRWNGTAWLPLSSSPVVSLRATSTAVESNASAFGTPDTMPITIPAATQIGDLLVLIVSQNSNATTVFNPIAGWTKQGEQRAGGAAFTMAIYTRLAQAGDAGSVVNTSMVNRENTTAHIRVYANVNQATPLDSSVIFGEVDPAATSGAAPSVTVASTNAMIVTVYAVPTTTGTIIEGSDWTDPAGFSNELTTCTISPNNNVALATYDQLASATGAQGPFTTSIPQSRRWATATVVVRGV